MNRLLLNSIFFILYILNCQCSTAENFKKLHNRIDNLSNFSLIRPYTPNLAICLFEVKIFKYNDKYAPTEKPVLIKKFNIGSGKYIHLNLSKGYYKLSSSFFNDSDKIIFLDGKSEAFFQFYLFSNGFFSKTELYFQEITKEETLGHLLEGNNMRQLKESDP